MFVRLVYFLMWFSVTPFFFRAIRRTNFDAGMRLIFTLLWPLTILVWIWTKIAGIRWSELG